MKGKKKVESTLYIYMKADCGMLAGSFPVSKIPVVVQFMLSCVKESEADSAKGEKK